MVREKGGELHATALHIAKHNLSGALSLRNLPIETIGALSPDPEISGRRHRRCRPGAGRHLDGPAGRRHGGAGPQLAGGPSWAPATCASSRPATRRAHPGRVFQGKLGRRHAGHARPARPTSRSVRRLEIDHFMPELAARYGARGWVTGEIEIHTALAGGSTWPSKLRLTEVMLYLESRTRRPPPPSPCATATSWRSPGTASAPCSTRPWSSGPAGDIEISGGGGDKALALKLKGDIAVKMLAPTCTSTSTIAAWSGCRRHRPGQAGHPAPSSSRGPVRLAGQDATVSVPTGKITITNSRVAITDLTVRMVDEFSDGAPRSRSRRRRHDRLQAQRLALQIEASSAARCPPSPWYSPRPPAWPTSTSGARPRPGPEDIDGTLVPLPCGLNADRGLRPGRQALQDRPPAHRTVARRRRPRGLAPRRPGPLRPRRGPRELAPAPARAHQRLPRRRGPHRAARRRSRPAQLEARGLRRPPHRHQPAFPRPRQPRHRRQRPRPQRRRQPDRPGAGSQRPRRDRG